MNIDNDFIDYIKQRFDIVKESNGHSNKFKDIREIRNKYKYMAIFGAGQLGLETERCLRPHNIKVDFICDNRYENICNKYKGIPKLISFEELCKYKNDVVVFVSPSNHKINRLINQQLTDNGFKAVISSSLWECVAAFRTRISDYECDEFIDKIEYIIELCDDKESKELVEKWIRVCFMDLKDLFSINYIESYFDEKVDQYFPDFVHLRNDECFVDCGAYNGDTYRLFYKNSKGVFEHYYAFELEEANRVFLKENILSDKISEFRYTIFPYGVGNKDEEVVVKRLENASYIVSGAVDNKYEYEKSKIVTIDECLKNDKVTFLKMDIENSEVPAIEGAVNIIKEQKPLCAISMYHSLTQFLEIPALLKRINPDYVIRYRLHSSIGHDIVCYAIDRNDSVRF